jgi:hypothetical protein
VEARFVVFDRELFTPNMQFFVRGIGAVILEAVDVAASGLVVRGLVDTVPSLSIAELLTPSVRDRGLEPLLA